MALWDHSLCCWLVVVMPYGVFRKGYKRARTPIPQDGTVAVSSRQAEVALAKKVARLTKLVKGITPEVKYLDTNLTFINVGSASGALGNIMALAQGADFNQRIGDKVRVKGIQFFVRISTAAGSIGASPTSEEFTRFMLVRDTQTVADTLPSPALVVNDPARPAYPVLNTANALGRFIIMWTSPLFVHSRCAQSSVAGGVTTPLSPSQTPTIFKSMKCDIPVTYNGTLSTDFQKNSMYMVCFTSLAAGTLDADCQVRIAYIDD